MSKREPIWHRYLRFLGPDAAADADDEIAHHLEMRVRALQAEGLTAEDAWHEARRRFGDVERISREVLIEDRQKSQDLHRRDRRWSLWTDLRLAVRSLARNPGFAIVVVLTLGVGIGSTTAVFSVVNGVLLESLPFPGADELVRVFTLREDGRRNTVSPADFEDWRSEARSFVGLAAIEEIDVALTGDGPAENVAAANVTPGFIDVLGVAPAIGRGFFPTLSSRMPIRHSSSERPATPPLSKARSALSSAASTPGCRWHRCER